MAQFTLNIARECGPRVYGRDRVAVAAPQPHREPEGAALPGRTRGPGLAAHQPRQVASNGQPQTGAAVAAGDGGVGLLEGTEEPRQLVCADTDAGVLHLEAHQQPRGRLLDKLCAQPDPAALGELDCIGGQVEQGLAQARRVAIQPAWHRVRIDLHAQPLGGGLVCDQ